MKERKENPMAGHIKIDSERCKGCGLCIGVCPRKKLVIRETSNKKGFFPADQVETIECSACGMCAIVCPEAIIEIYRDGKIIAIEPNKKQKPSLTREKV